MSGGSKVQTTRTEPWEQQKPYLERGFEFTEDLYRGGQLNPAYYGGQTVAGFTPAQQAAQEATLRYATDPQTENFMGAAQGGLGSLMAGDVNTDVFGPLADAYRTEAMGQLTGEVLPGIREEIVKTQPGGGTRGDLVQGTAVGATGQRIADNLAKAQFDAYQQAQNRRMGAFSQYPSILGAPLGMTGAVGQVGAQQQAMDQQMLDADRAKYAYDAQRSQLGLQNYMAGISGEYGGTSTATGPAGPNPMLTALAGGLGYAAGGPLGAGVANMFMPKR